MVVAGTPALAQQTGSLLLDPAARLSDRNITPADQARETMDAYATCLVKTNRAGVSKLIDEGRLDKDVSKLATSECLVDGSLRMPPLLLSGAVYRALYIREFGVDAPTPINTPLFKDEDPLQRFGSCVNIIDSVNSRLLVTALPATPKERFAVSALGPAFSRCVAGGNKIAFSLGTIQAVLARAAYLQGKYATSVEQGQK